MESRTKLALKYLSYGWSVIPVHIPIDSGCSCGRDDCSYPGKHPRINWQQFSARLPTENEVTEWFEQSYYGSNIGMVTGTVSGVVVIDVDGDPMEYVKLALPEPTLVSRTGGGGLHHFFACDIPIRSLGQATSKRKGFAPGIDLKAEGGFVVLPPSVHESGARYEWATRMPPQKLDPKSLPVTTETNSSHHDDQTWFENLLLGVEEGGRSDAAAKLAGRYAYLGLSSKEAFMIMVLWNEMNSPPMPSPELKRTIRSVYQRHRNNNTRVETIGELMSMLDEVEKRR